jgi:hypothetical protein
MVESGDNFLQCNEVNKNNNYGGYDGANNFKTYPCTSALPNSYDAKCNYYIQDKENGALACHPNDNFGDAKDNNYPICDNRTDSVYNNTQKDVCHDSGGGGGEETTMCSLYYPTYLNNKYKKLNLPNSNFHETIPCFYENPCTNNPDSPLIDLTITDDSYNKALGCSNIGAPKTCNLNANDCKDSLTQSKKKMDTIVYGDDENANYLTNFINDNFNNNFADKNGSLTKEGSDKTTFTNKLKEHVTKLNVTRDTTGGKLWVIAISLCIYLMYTFTYPAFDSSKLESKIFAPGESDSDVYFGYYYTFEGFNLFKNFSHPICFNSDYLVPQSLWDRGRSCLRLVNVTLKHEIELENGTSAAKIFGSDETSPFAKLAFFFFPVVFGTYAINYIFNLFRGKDFLGTYSKNYDINAPEEENVTEIKEKLNAITDIDYDNIYAYEKQWAELFYRINNPKSALNEKLDEEYLGGGTDFKNNASHAQSSVTKIKKLREIMPELNVSNYQNLQYGMYMNAFIIILLLFIASSRLGLMGYTIDGYTPNTIMKYIGNFSGKVLFGCNILPYLSIFITLMAIGLNKKFTSQDSIYVDTWVNNASGNNNYIPDQIASNLLYRGTNDYLLLYKIVGIVSFTVCVLFFIYMLYIGIKSRKEVASRKYGYRPGPLLPIEQVGKIFFAYLFGFICCGTGGYKSVEEYRL